MNQGPLHEAPLGRRDLLRNSALAAAALALRAPLAACGKEPAPRPRAESLAATPPGGSGPSTVDRLDRHASRRAVVRAHDPAWPQRDARGRAGGRHAVRAVHPGGVPARGWQPIGDRAADALADPVRLRHAGGGLPGSGAGGGRRELADLAGLWTRGGADALPRRGAPRVRLPAALLQRVDRRWRASRPLGGSGRPSWAASRIGARFDS